MFIPLTDRSTLDVLSIGSDFTKDPQRYPKRNHSWVYESNHKNHPWEWHSWYVEWVDAYTLSQLETSPLRERPMEGGQGRLYGNCSLEWFFFKEKDHSPFSTAYPRERFLLWRNLEEFSVSDNNYYQGNKNVSDGQGIVQVGPFVYQQYVFPTGSYSNYESLCYTEGHNIIPTVHPMIILF